MRARRAAGAVAVVLAAPACAERALGPDPARDPAAVFDAAWRAYDRDFAFFADKGLDWDAAGARARRTLPGPVVADAAAEAQLFGAVCDLVRATGSLHSALDARVGDAARACTPPAGRRQSRFDPAFARGRYLRATGATRGGHVVFGLLPSWAGVDAATGAPRGVAGYVAIPSFAGAGWAGEVDEAIASLRAQIRAVADTVSLGALVLDVRRNGGGSEPLARAVAGRFVDRERVYSLRRVRTGPARDALGPPEETRVAPAGPRFAGRVVLLTDRGTASAAEDFVMMLRAVPGVLVAGDTTSGTSSLPLPRQLPNGWWLRVPASMVLTPDGALVVEGRGLPPALPAPAGVDDEVAGRDPALDAAIGALTGFRFGG